MREIQKVRFSILLPLKGCLYRVGKYGFIQHIYSPPYSSSRKVCSRWIPCQLTDENKNICIWWILMLLQLYEEHGEALLRRTVTALETWVSHYTPESKA